MFTEQLETRRFMSVTLRPATPPGPSDQPGMGTPDCLVVTQDRNGNVTISVKENTTGKHGKRGSHNLGQWKKDSHGKYNFCRNNGGGSSNNRGSHGRGSHGGGSHGGGSHGGGDDDCTMTVAIVEDNGVLTVTEISTLATWDVTNATSVKVIGSENADDIFYTGNSIGAKINAGDGNDSVTIIDQGTGRSSVYGEGGNDGVNVIMGNYTYISGGNGDDTIYLMSGIGQYDTANGEAIVDAGNGNDTIVQYDGRATINGQAGNDVALLLGGTATVTSASVQS